MTNRLLLAFLVVVFSGCTTAPSASQPSMSASFYDMQDKMFSVQAIAPTQVIREYTICKVVWFAEKKNAERVALGDPKYGNSPQLSGVGVLEIPDGWAVLDATAFLSEPKSTKNPFVNVSEIAKTCRAGWDWYL